MTRFKIVVPDPFSADLDSLHTPFEGLDVDIVVPERDWRNEARDADGLIVNLTAVDAEFISTLERCRIIARLGTGTDNVDRRQPAPAILPFATSVTIAAMKYPSMYWH